ncbi:MAG: type VI secretion system tube protein Hcp [Candidatus Nitrosotenuis sp.]
MKTVILMAAVLGLVFAISAIQPSSAQFVDPIYMKYDGIDGEVAVQGHEREIELNSFQFGIARAIGSPGAGSGRESSAPSISEIVVTKVMDKASPKLFEQALVGTPRKVDIFFVLNTGSGPVTYAQYTLEDVLVSRYSVSSGGDRPTESLSLNFAKITFKHTVIDQQGKPGSSESVGYDLALGKKI